MFPSKLHSQHRRSQTLQPLHPPVSTHIYKHTPARARLSGRELQQANLWGPREGKGQGTQTGLTSLPPFRVSKLETPYTNSTYTSNFFQTWWSQEYLKQHSLLTLGQPLRNIRHFRSQRYFNGWERGFCWTCGPQAHLWTPHFLQWEVIVICHLGPGRGTIAQSGPWLPTPSHGLLIRHTFLRAEPLLTHSLVLCHSYRWPWNQRKAHCEPSILINKLPSISSRLFKLYVDTSASQHVPIMLREHWPTPNMEQTM